VPSIALTSHLDSPLARVCSHALCLPVEREACPHDLAPTSSTTALMAMGDALAIALFEQRGFGAEHFARLHPGGELGRQLQAVSAVMSTGEARPLVRSDAPMPEVVREISAKGLGIVGVVDGEGRLLGCITDGDLRRLLLGGIALSGTAAEHMHGSPLCVAPGTTVREARARMHAARVTALFVTEGAEVRGVVQIHQVG
jgi:arabinose-5-phosphate isomerase